MFNALQLRKGDFVLIEEPPFKDPKAAKVVLRLGSGIIEVEKADKTRLSFDLRKGYKAIVAGARLVDGQWIAL